MIVFATEMLEDNEFPHTRKQKSFCERSPYFKHFLQ